ncbi:MAG: hypothetical protein KDI13_09535 [Alphaproteobacteria bacterium]|nr:hypothetical protein [Alphaproteobacteria bacterium]
MSEAEKPECNICHGPHATKSHNAWIEMPREMAQAEIAAELVKYRGFLQAMKTGGIREAEKEILKAGLSLNGRACFCGTKNHTSVDHLRWLADKETEI